uniref:Uncharacterized protein n=1 Tax=Noccaea caerulescens TaxID=107243 RepID=A0A1J3IP07_NOCCA
MHQRSPSFSPNRPAPPGATSASNSATARYPQVSIAALLSSPARREQPTLHPQKLNGALWFKIDKCVNRLITTQWQENFYGRWWNWTLVPQEKKDKWWSDFVQSYYWAPEHHNLVSFHWKEEVKDSIGNLVSKRKRSGVRPPYINESDWNLMLEEWSTEPALKKSKSAATSRISSKDGRGMHKHTAGAQSFLKIEYDMMIASGVGMIYQHSQKSCARHTHAKTVHLLTSVLRPS